MNSISSHPAIEPDFSHLDTAEEILRDAANWGLVEDLRALLCKDCISDDALGLLRRVVDELAASADRDLAVDMLIHVTGVSLSESSSAGDLARKHGCSCEQFMFEVEAMRARLQLALGTTRSSTKALTSRRQVG